MHCIDIYLYIHSLFLVCDVLPLVMKNVDMRLPANLMQKYMLKAAEFYIGYVTRGPSSDGQIHGNSFKCTLTHTCNYFPVPGMFIDCKLLLKPVTSVSSMLFLRLSRWLS